MRVNHFSTTIFETFDKREEIKKKKLSVVGARARRTRQPVTVSSAT